ncbi:MAG: hypothetical protein FGM39_10240, partial [Phycisphaerales bacterium]|nr:hypothetical protein [Phycisphaerales bacterium]
MITAALIAASAALAQDPAPAGTAATPASQRVKDAIWVASWGGVPPDARNLAQMVRLSGAFHPLAESESVNPEDLARRLKNLPRGRRTMLIGRYAGSFWGHRPDQTEQGALKFATPWPDAAIAGIERDWPRILQL